MDAPTTDRVFVNCSNHPNENWPVKQRAAAHDLGATAIIDLPSDHIQVDAEADAGAIVQQAHHVVEAIKRLRPSWVFVAGEFRLSFVIVAMLQADGIEVVSAAARRDSEETVAPNGQVTKRSRFDFVAWQRFPALSRVAA